VKDESQHVDPESLRRGYERDEVQIKPIVRWTVLVLAIMLFTVLLVRIAYRRADHVGVSDPARSEANPANPFATDHGQPVLQRSPAFEMKEFLAKENATLESYDWVDRSSEHVRIPIERAKVLLLQKGLPIRGAHR
jgi:hypothetical protein